MRDEDKPFICYKQRWGVKIVPRNAAGWWAFACWLVGFFVMAGLFMLGMSRQPESGAMIAMLCVYIVAVLLWAIAMIRWMKARSEIVDIDELLALKRDRDRGQRAGRR